MCGLLWRQIEKFEQGGHLWMYVPQLKAEKVKWEIRFNNKGDKTKEIKQKFSEEMNFSSCLVLDQNSFPFWKRGF